MIKLKLYYSEATKRRDSACAYSKNDPEQKIHVQQYNLKKPALVQSRLSLLWKAAVKVKELEFVGNVKDLHKNDLQ